MSIQLNNIPENKINILPQRFERKFFIKPSHTYLAFGLLRHACVLSEEYPSELINSLYFDSLELDQYERSESGDYEKDKIRIRWYGDDFLKQQVYPVFLELKSRRGFAGIKQRLKFEVPSDALKQGNLHQGIIPYSTIQETLARFGFFTTKKIWPVIKITYWRYRFIDPFTGQRLSLDLCIRSRVILPCFGQTGKEVELPGGVIEIKGQTADIPNNLTELHMLDVDWTRFSKYAASIDAHREYSGSVGYLSPSGRILKY